MANVIDVANYILEISREDSPGGDYDLISPLKLQKLIYFCQGYFLALQGEPLFPDPIEAWEHGPVCPMLYHLFKSYGSAPLMATVDPGRLLLDKREKNIINMVYQAYRQYSASGLRNITHREGPWVDTWEVAKNTVIKIEAMLEYFKALLDVPPQRIPLSSESEKRELAEILKKAEANGEIDLSRFCVPVGI